MLKNILTLFITVCLLPANVLDDDPGKNIMIYTKNGEGFVHKVSIAHPANPCKNTRRKLAFLHGKFNTHFISHIPEKN